MILNNFPSIHWKKNFFANCYFVSISRVQNIHVGMGILNAYIFRRKNLNLMIGKIIIISLTRFVLIIICTLNTHTLIYIYIYIFGPYIYFWCTEETTPPLLSTPPLAIDWDSIDACYLCPRFYFNIYIYMCVCTCVRGGGSLLLFNYSSKNL